MFADEVDLAYEILQSEVVKHRAHGIAIVRQAEGDGYFNGYAFLNQDNEFVNSPMMIGVLGTASPNSEEARLFLLERTDNYDWTELVRALQARALNIVYITDKLDYRL